MLALPGFLASHHFANGLEKEHITIKIWEHLNNQMHGLPSCFFPWRPKAWLKSLSEKKWCLSMEKARNVSQNHARGSRGENRDFAECLATVSQAKIQWLLRWSQLCCYKSTDYFCITLDLQHCNQPHSLFGPAGANELYFLTKAHSGDFFWRCHPASGLSYEDKAWRQSMSNSCFL